MNTEILIDKIKSISKQLESIDEVANPDLHSTNVYESEGEIIIDVNTWRNGDDVSTVSEVTDCLRHLDLEDAGYGDGDGYTIKMLAVK